MDLKLFSNDAALELKAERNGDKLVVNCEGKNHAFAVTNLGECEYLLRSGDRLQRVTAIKSGSRIHVLTENEAFSFELPMGKDADSFGADHGDHGDKSKIAAPMPGKVVKVLVKAGDVVEPKQKLVIVEAMKMENPLIAPFKAEIKAINCGDGELVDAERILIELTKLE